MKGIDISNKKVYYDYYIEDTIECGIELRGNEVKSIKAGKASIKEAWVSVDNNEVILKQMHITAWETSNKFDVDENRSRKLLLHKQEIRELSKGVQREGYTIVPIKVYEDRGRIKVLIGLAKGKHNYDKRACEKEKREKLEAARAIKR